MSDNNNIPRIGCNHNETVQEVKNNDPPQWMVVGAVMLMAFGLMTIGYLAVVMFDVFLSMVEGYE